MAKRGLQFLPQRRATEPSPLGASIELGVGDILRMNRERRGQELQSVANQLRIRLAYLEAIEEGRYKDLPGSTYAVGFVRSYGDYLGLDGADIVRRFREEVARIHGRTRLIPPVIAADGTIPPAAMLLLSVVGIGIAYGAWYYFSSSDQSPVPVVQDVPARMIDAPDGTAGTQPEAAHAPAAGSSQDGSSDSAAATESEPGNSPSNLSTIMAPEPTTGSPEAETFVPPPPPTVLPAAPPTVEAPAATTAPVGETLAAPAPTAAAPATPPAPAEDTAPSAPGQTADTTAEVPSAPGTATPPAATSPPAAPSATEPATPPAAAESTATPPPTASPPPEVPAAGMGSSETPPSQTAAADNTIPSAPALPTPEAEATETPPATAAIPSGTRIRINARLDTWIKIVDHNGRTVLNRVLTSGEGYDVPDEAGLKMITGNAGGMDILVDGVAIAPLGEPGKVRRDVELDPEKLKAGTAIPQ